MIFPMLIEKSSNLSESVLTKTDIESGRQGDMTKSTIADFNLAVAHIREDLNLIAMKKTNK